MVKVYNNYIINISFESDLSNIIDELNGIKEDVEELESLIYKFHQLLEGYENLNVINLDTYALMTQMQEIYKNDIETSKKGLLKLPKYQFRTDKDNIKYFYARMIFNNKKIEEVNNIINNIMLNLNTFNEIYSYIFGILDTINYNLGHIVNERTTEKIKIDDKVIYMSQYFIILITERGILSRFKEMVDKMFLQKELFNGTEGNLEKFINMVKAYSKKVNKNRRGRV